MKLTIIPVDGTVIKDGIVYFNLNLTSCEIPNDIHALQWLDAAGWIEFGGGVPNEDITVLPDWANCCVGLWQTADYDAHHPADPTPPTAEENKQTASKLLYDTDWTTIPDVSDPTKSNPYLGNTEEFVTYRNAVRQYAVTPTEGYINWPVVPKAVWVAA